MPVKMPVAHPFVYASEKEQAEMLAHWVGVATYHIAVSVSPGSTDDVPRIIVSKGPDTVTVNVPAKNECELTFAPYSGTISLQQPTGNHATVGLTLKDGKDVHKSTFYIEELVEHGADLMHDPPLRPCINPFWILQKTSRETDKQTPNMMQRIISIPCTHTIVLPKDIKVQGKKALTVTLDLPVLVNAGPLETGDTLVLE